LVFCFSLTKYSQFNMAKCAQCGGKAPMFSNECGSCKSERKAQEQAQREEMAEAARREQEEALAERAESIRQTVDVLIEQAKSGVAIYLHESVYLPVDSVLEGQTLAQGFDVQQLRSLGWSGWRIVAIVPKTVGIGLTNKSIGASTGETWGAGMGGNVAGVYVLIELAVSSLQAEALRETIQAHVERAL
jgi:hypothetical protein